MKLRPFNSVQLSCQPVWKFLVFELALCYQQFILSGFSFHSVSLSKRPALLSSSLTGSLIMLTAGLLSYASSTVCWRGFTFCVFLSEIQFKSMGCVKKGHITDTRTKEASGGRQGERKGGGGVWDPVPWNKFTSILSWAEGFTLHLQSPCLPAYK